jgi:hypothetical protein
VKTESTPSENIQTFSIDISVETEKHGRRIYGPRINPHDYNSDST